MSATAREQHEELIVTLSAMQSSLIRLADNLERVADVLDDVTDHGRVIVKAEEAS